MSRGKVIMLSEFVDSNKTNLASQKIPAKIAYPSVYQIIQNYAFHSFKFIVISYKEMVAFTSCAEIRFIGY